MWSAWALGELGPPIEGLLRALSDESPAVRREALWAVEKTGERAAAPAVMALLQDSAAWIRQRAATALGMLGDAAAVGHLVDALIRENSGPRHSPRRVRLQWGDENHRLSAEDEYVFLDGKPMGFRVGKDSVFAAGDYSFWQPDEALVLSRAQALAALPEPAAPQKLERLRPDWSTPIRWCVSPSPLRVPSSSSRARPRPDRAACPQRHVRSATRLRRQASGGRRCRRREGQSRFAALRPDPGASPLPERSSRARATH